MALHQKKPQNLLWFFRFSYSGFKYMMLTPRIFYYNIYLEN